MDGDPVSLGEGVYFAGNLLAIKIYLVLLVSYIVFRVKKVRGKKHLAVEEAGEEAPSEGRR
jgi:hypothetical protein